MTAAENVITARTPAALDVFAPGLLGARCWLELADGERIALSVDRWRAESDPGDAVLLDHCAGPTLDVGCGPGRLTAALARRGVAALGIDVSPVAVALTRSRGAAALRRDVFDPLPSEGRWAHVLLADGNIGIGGDPVRLLRRVRDLVSPSGSALVEIDAPGRGLRSARARLTRDCGSGPWFDWAVLGVDSTPTAAAEAGMAVRWIRPHDGRWFAELAQA